MSRELSLLFMTLFLLNTDNRTDIIYSVIIDHSCDHYIRSYVVKLVNLIKLKGVYYHLKILEWAFMYQDEEECVGNVPIEISSALNKFLKGNRRNSIQVKINGQRIKRDWFGSTYDIYGVHRK